MGEGIFIFKKDALFGTDKKKHGVHWYPYKILRERR